MGPNNKAEIIEGEPEKLETSRLPRNGQGEPTRAANSNQESN